jgi:hypothetical protein
VRRPLLAALHTALPPVGDALAALVAYGSAHVFMRAASGRARTASEERAAAAAAGAAAAADEVVAAAAAAAAAAESAAAGAEVGRLGGLAGGALSDASSWCERHLRTLKSLVEVPLPPELTAPSDAWRSPDAPCPLLLVAPGAGAAGAAGSLLAAALAAAPGVSPDHALPPAVWQQCAALDARGGALLAERDEVLTGALTALLQYSLVLRGVLPGARARRGRGEGGLTRARACTTGRQRGALGASRLVAAARSHPLLHLCLPRPSPEDYGSDSHHAKYAEAFSLALSATTSDAVAAAATAAPAAAVPSVVAAEWTCLAAAHAAAAARPALLLKAAKEAAADGGRGGAEEARLGEELRSRLAAASAGLDAGGGGGEAEAAAAQLAVAGGVGAALRAAADEVEALRGALDAGGDVDTDAPSAGAAQAAPLERALRCLLGAQHLVAAVTEDATSAPATLLTPALRGSEDGGAQQPEEEEWEGGSGGGGDGDRGGSSPQSRLARSGAALMRALQLLSAVHHQALPALMAWAADEEPPAGGGGSGDAPQGPGATAPDTPGEHRHVWRAACVRVAAAREELAALLERGRALEARLNAGQDASDDLAAPPPAAGVPGSALAAWQLQQEWGEVDAAVLTALQACLGPLLGITDAAGLQDAAAAAVAEAAAATGGVGGDGGAPPPLAQPAAPLRAGSPHLMDAWQPLAHALLQLAALAAVGEPAGGPGGGAAAQAEPQTGGGDAGAPLAAGPLPLDLDRFRPLLGVVDALNALLAMGTSPDAPGAGGRPAAAAAAGAARMEAQLAVAALAAHLPAAAGALADGARAAAQLRDEAAAVLSRLARAGADACGGGAPSARRAARGGSGRRRRSREAWEAAEQAPLVPFTAFDPALAGAGQVLEEAAVGEEEESLGGLEAAEEEDDDDGWGALLAGSEPGSCEEDEDEDEDEAAGGEEAADGEAPGWLLDGSQASSGGGKRRRRRGSGGGRGAGLPKLVPFDAFDPALPGAGVALDNGLEPGNGGSSSSGSGGGEHASEEGSRDAPTAGALAAWPPLAAEGEATALAEVLARAAGEYAAAAGAARMHEARYAALAALPDACEAQRRMWLRHLAAFEWLWEAELPPAPRAPEEQGQGRGDPQAAALAARAAALLAAGARALGERADSVAAAAAAAAASTDGGAALALGAAYQAQCCLVEAHAGYARTPGWRELLAAWKVRSRAAAAPYPALSPLPALPRLPPH